jgi:hypothetical protein
MHKLSRGTPIPELIRHKKEENMLEKRLEISTSRPERGHGMG